jgi:hypothetical protein
MATVLESTCNRAAVLWIFLSGMRKTPCGRSIKRRLLIRHILMVLEHSGEQPIGLNVRPCFGLFDGDGARENSEKGPVGVHR